jgi:hypothetical protein
MGGEAVEWAGVRFFPLHYHDARFFRRPGLWAFVRREVSGERTLLFVDHSDNIAGAVSGHRLWSDALGLGLNELNINLKAIERVDRLLLKGRVVKRCAPLLNLLEEEAPPLPGPKRDSSAGRIVASKSVQIRPHETNKSN